MYIPQYTYLGYSGRRAPSIGRAPTPDVPLEVRVGELRGWRAWDVKSTTEMIGNGTIVDKTNYRLTSLTIGTVWPSGVVGPNDTYGNSGEVFRCGASGYYAYKSLSGMQKDLFGVWSVYGEVELYGNVVEHTEGYRAEYCKILSLYSAGLHNLPPPPRNRGFKEWMNWKILTKKSREDIIMDQLRDFYIKDK